MADGDFDERMSLLIAGNIGTLEGELVVDQHYALDQHENMQYNHPRGGGPKYLWHPLLLHYELYLGMLGAALETTELKDGMIAALEHLSLLLDPAAPIDKDPNPIRLRRSGQPFVYDNGRVVYHRPPVDAREPMGVDDEDKYDSDGFRLDMTY